RYAFGTLAHPFQSKSKRCSRTSKTHPVVLDHETNLSPFIANEDVKTVRLRMSNGIGNCFLPNLVKSVAGTSRNGSRDACTGSTHVHRSAVNHLPCGSIQCWQQAHGCRRLRSKGRYTPACFLVTMADQF